MTRTWSMILLTGSLSVAQAEAPRWDHGALEDAGRQAFPYEVARVFPKDTFKEPVMTIPYLADGARWMLILGRKGEFWSCPDGFGEGEPHLAFHLGEHLAGGGNPWRMAFHPENGELWLGDNGDEHWELVQRIVRGANYGWSAFEGSHVFRAGFQFMASLPLEETGVVNARAVVGLAIGPDALIVAPGAPDRSELLARMARRGAGQMPLIGSHVVDQQGVALIREWILSLDSGQK